MNKSSRRGSGERSGCPSNAPRRFGRAAESSPGPYLGGCCTVFNVLLSFSIIPEGDFLLDLGSLPILFLRFCLHQWPLATWHAGATSIVFCMLLFNVDSPLQVIRCRPLGQHLLHFTHCCATFTYHTVFFDVARQGHTYPAFSHFQATSKYQCWVLRPFQGSLWGGVGKPN